MKPKEFRAWLERHEACAESLEWLGGRDLREAWEACPRVDWLAWLIYMAVYVKSTIGSEEFEKWHRFRDENPEFTIIFPDGDLTEEEHRDVLQRARKHWAVEEIEAGIRSLL